MPSPIFSQILLSWHLLIATNLIVASISNFTQSNPTSSRPTLSNENMSNPISSLTVILSNLILPNRIPPAQGTVPNANVTNPVSNSTVILFNLTQSNSTSSRPTLSNANMSNPISNPTVILFNLTQSSPTSSRPTVSNTNMPNPLSNPTVILFNFKLSFRDNKVNISANIILTSAVLQKLDKIIVDWSIHVLRECKHTIGQQGLDWYSPYCLKDKDHFSSTILANIWLNKIKQNSSYCYANQIIRTQPIIIDLLKLLQKPTSDMD